MQLEISVTNVKMYSVEVIHSALEAKGGGRMGWRTQLNK